MKNTVSNINIINTILEALDRSEEDIRRRAADAAANEVGYAYGAGSLTVKLFSDCTGNYAEVTLPGSYEYACGMKLCCIVDTDTMEVRGDRKSTRLNSSHP